LFGEQFEAAFPVLVLLLIGQIVNCSTGALYPMLKMVGKERMFSCVAGLGLLLNLVLGVILASWHGAMGMALATTSSLVFVNCVLGWYSIRNLKLNPFPTPAAILLLLSVLQKKTL
jgi:O-antigen/teichoic acid export membrane protein